ncbi:hypothetical protein [Kitasatospora sp. NPDC047058]|uniref:hypothetical protein n=1 Tax=Kitasatospora sp. NPDC047058 TaxID=3155620 RepID=UPI0033F1F0BD
MSGRRWRGTSDPKGSTIKLKPGGDARNVTCTVLASVQKDDDGMNLCLVEDPDQTCGEAQLLRKQPAG